MVDRARLIVPTLCFLLILFYFISGNHEDGTQRRLAGTTSQVLQDFLHVRDLLKPRDLTKAPKGGPSGPSGNKVTYMFVLGAEGAGVEAITPIVATIAKTCNNYVLYKNLYLKSSRMKARGTSYMAYLKSTKASRYENTNNVFIVEDASFPSENVLLNSTLEEKESNPRYDVDWIYNQINQVGNIESRFLYVGRDLYRTVGTLEPEAFHTRLQTVNDFINYISLEYELINTKKAGIWGQVHYEWFTELRNCTALVSAIIDFAGWDRCDVEYACKLLPTVLPRDQPDPVDAENFEYAATKAQDVPIPELDISGLKPYKFTPAVSERKYFTYANTSRPVQPPRNVPTGRKPVPVVDRWHNFTTPVRNSVSLLYIIGVEGTGHHGVTPAVASIAKTCNYHVVYENTQLRRAQTRMLMKTYRSAMSAYKHFTYPTTNKVLIVEDSSFPTAHEARVCSAEQKKSMGRYNLEWIHEQAVAAGLQTRFLYLTRDFYRAVASHPEFDNGFRPHADVLYDYTKYIHSEYEITKRKQKNLWAQVHYEWFTELRNCTALVSAIIDFAGWDGCDIEYACQVLRETLRSTTKRPVNATDLAYVQTLDVTSPVPLLDISDNRTFSFKTELSARKPFSFIMNMTNRVSRYKLSRPSTYGKSFPSLASPAGRSVNNNVTLLYLAGVLGAGHEAVTDMIATVARSCNYHVMVENKSLRRSQSKLLPRSYMSALNAYQHSVYKDTSKVLVIEGFPLYADGERPTGTVLEKRQYGKYNLAWVYVRGQETDSQVKFLYLNRTFTDILAESYNASVAFAPQAQSVHDFIWYIHEEKERVDKLQTGLWGQVTVDRLLNTTLCNTQARAVADFVGLTECDIKAACGNLAPSGPQTKSPAVKALTAEERKIAAKYMNTVALPIKAIN